MSSLSGKSQTVGLIVWVALAFAAGAIGGIASLKAATFYDELARPGWAPPSNVFGPVWSILYALMGIAAWLVWRVAGFAAARAALILFLIQLALNALWTWLFFGWHLGAWSFADIALLWVLIAATLVAFWRVRPLAGILLLPYWLWVSYAAALNWSVWQLNPIILG